MADNSFIGEGLEVFNTTDSLAYPSANAINGGELNSEENIRNIVTRISTKSFVIKRLPNAENEVGTVISNENETLDNDNSFGLSYNNNILCIAPGECNIRAYYFRSKSQININFDDYISSDTDNDLKDLFTNWSTYIPDSDNATLYVYLVVKQDSTNHILSYSNVNLNFTNFQGVVVAFTTELQSAYDLLLGTVSVSKTATGININGTTNNKYKFTFIDTDDIFHYDKDIEDIISIYDLILKYIKNNMSDSIHNDLTVLGPTNSDGTTNIFITSPNNNNVFRLYYDHQNNVGGLALYSGTQDENGNVILGSPIKELLQFTNLPTTSTSSDPSLTINANTTLNEAVSIIGDATISGLLSTDINANAVTLGSRFNNINVSIFGNVSFPNGNTTISSDAITADRVYGAVWA